MENNKPKIDPYLFDQQFIAFSKFIVEKSGMSFVSFSSNPYIELHEAYKFRIYQKARENLAFQTWKSDDIGTAKIVDATIKAIEIPKNNLLKWQAQYGERKRVHNLLYEAKKDNALLISIEKFLFQFYREDNNEASFSTALNIFGKKYPLLAYLFFIKDRSRFLPIPPKFFDETFKDYLGCDFKASQRCSWENYLTYMGLMNDIKIMLSNEMNVEVTLLDAHTFVWILSSQMRSEKALANIDEYLSLSETEREAVRLERKGQDIFRRNLIDYWSSCAVTGCKEEALLQASHIKPWVESSDQERVHIHHNGLLLSPTFHTAFDAGYISFDSNGVILISSKLHESDAVALGINSEMRLAKFEQEHEKYLVYHREHIFMH